MLRTGGTGTGALFSLLDMETGKVVGFDAGLSQMLAQYTLGEPTTELTVTTVDTRETLIQNGSVDGVFATYSITPGRAEKVAFAGPYLISGAAIMVRADNTDITSVRDLAGRNVTTQTNSTSLTALQDKGADHEAAAVHQRRRMGRGTDPGPGRCVCHRPVDPDQRRHQQP